MFRCDAWWCLVPTSGSVCLLWIFCGMLAISTDTYVLWFSDLQKTCFHRRHQDDNSLEQCYESMNDHWEWDLTYSTLGKGTSLNMPWEKDTLVPRRVIAVNILSNTPSTPTYCFGRAVDLKSFSRLKTSLTHGSKQSIITQVAMCLYILIYIYTYDMYVYIYILDYII